MIDAVKFRVLMLGFRQAVLILLGVLEDFLEMPRSVTPKHERDR